MLSATILDFLTPGRPTIICDVDEVVLHFVAPFETYLTEQGARLNKTSFKIGGNIIKEATGEAFTKEQSTDLIRAFHRIHVDQQPVVAGAIDALNALAERFQILFLTNVEQGLEDRRQTHLHGLGLPYPVIQNDGSKAEMAAAIHDHVGADTIFIDDLPPHHMMVKAAAPAIRCVHFMADTDFANLVDLPDDVAAMAPDWKAVRDFCEAT